MKTKHNELETVRYDKWETVISWFEKHYQGKPIEMEIKTKDGKYRCTLSFNVKELN